jgi:hypothetical protein
MKPVARHEIVDYVTYEDQRERFRAEVIQAKTPRRVHFGEYFTLLFENHLTVRYQIQEMIRAERIVRESDILHEIQTYNELLGKQGELGCTLLIEIEAPSVRSEKLTAWLQLPEKIYLSLEDGSRVYATSDQRQRDEHRLSSVQYLKFDTKGRVPIAVGVDAPELRVETRLTSEQITALLTDLGNSVSDV